jgi:Calponin homology (CH) domain
MQGIQKYELLKWINSKSACEYQKIEDLGDCVAYCHIIEILYPTSIKFQNLNLNPKTSKDLKQNVAELKKAIDTLGLSNNQPKDLP